MKYSVICNFKFIAVVFDKIMERYSKETTQLSHDSYIVIKHFLFPFL